MHFSFLLLLKMRLLSLAQYIHIYRLTATHTSDVQSSNTCQVYIPELLSTLKVFGGFSLEDFKEPSNTHALFTDAPPNSCIMKETPTRNKILIQDSQLEFNGKHRHMYTCTSTEVL